MRDRQTDRPTRGDFLAGWVEAFNDFFGSLSGLVNGSAHLEKCF